MSHKQPIIGRVREILMGRIVDLKQALEIVYEKRAWKDFVRGVLKTLCPGISPNLEMPLGGAHFRYNLPRALTAFYLRWATGQKGINDYYFSSHFPSFLWC